MFTIKTLKIGELYLPHHGKIMRDPVHVWLVQNGEVNILVDSGMPASEDVLRTLKVDGIGGGHAALKQALAAEGLGPDDIHYVVPTHLHFDHGSNLDFFPNSCVVVQRDEVFHAIDPSPTHRIYYPRDILIEIINRKRPKTLRYIDGDLTLIPGFHILKVPSHTAGMQVPIVTTTKGKVGLVSDLGDHYHYWYPADPRANRNPKRFLSDTFLPGDIVIPAHDSRIPKVIPDEWFDIPDGFDGDISFEPIGDHPELTLHGAKA
jgi:glyoxylase-like metal-dependent hydrolase (beta-lactamase superfamily II)